MCGCFLQAGCPCCCPTNSVKALKATSAFGLGRRCLSSPQRCYLHRLRTVRLRTIRKKMWGWQRWALVSPDGVATSQMVCVSASVSLPLYLKVQDLLAPAHPGGPGKRAVKRLCVCVQLLFVFAGISFSVG